MYVPDNFLRISINLDNLIAVHPGHFFFKQTPSIFFILSDLIIQVMDEL